MEIQFDGDKEITDENGQVVTKRYTQTIKSLVLDGDLKNTELVVDFSRQSDQVVESEKIKMGEEIVIIKTPDATKEEGFSYFIDGKYRLNNMIILIVVFFVVLVLITGLKGFSSTFGLIIGIYGIAQFIIPTIVAGKDAFWVSVIFSAILGVIAIYFAHGLNRKSHVGVISTLITLAIAVLFSIWFVNFTKLSGLANEDSIFILGYNANNPSRVNINILSLLLGGIIIGTLGVLDDITMAQAASVEEIYKADPTMDFWKLFNSSLIIGKEHIASMVNTLAFAYVGVALPMLVTFTITNDGKPWWVIVNSELIAEEVIRTLVGSFTLLLAVPIATFLGVWIIGRFKWKDVKNFRLGAKNNNLKEELE